MTRIELNNHMSKKDTFEQIKSRDERANRRGNNISVARSSSSTTSLEESKKSSAAIDFDGLVGSMSAANLTDSSQPKSAVSVAHQTPLKEKVRSGSKDSDDSYDSKSSTEVHGNPEGNPTHKSVVSPSSGRYSTTIERGRTAIGPQVEHATARVVYSRMVDQVIDSTTISKTRDALREAFSHLPISSADLRGMGNVVDEAEGRISIFKAERENIKKLKGRTDLPFNPDLVNEVMVEGIKSMNAKTAAILIDCAVFAANKMPYANFPTEGVPTNPNTGSEQTAKNRLGLLSDVIESVATIRDLSEKTDERSQRKLQEERDRFQEYFSPKRQGNLREHWGITGEQVDDLLEKKTVIDDLFTAALQDKIANHVGQLFYYPRLTDPHENIVIDGVLGDWAVTQEEWNKTMARDADSVAKCKAQKYNLGALPRSNNPEIMYDVVGRHLVATFNAFRGLSGFGRENQEAIVDGFLEKAVLENSGLNRNQGWEGLVDSETGNEIDLVSAKEEIGKVTTLDHDSRIFAAKDSHIRSQLKKPNEIEAREV